MPVFSAIAPGAAVNSGCYLARCQYYAWISELDLSAGIFLRNRRRRDTRESPNDLAGIGIHQHQGTLRERQIDECRGHGQRNSDANVMNQQKRRKSPKKIEDQ